MVQTHRTELFCAHKQQIMNTIDFFVFVFGRTQ
jgi:hypothetical protein